MIYMEEVVPVQGWSLEALKWVGCLHTPLYEPRCLLGLCRFLSVLRHTYSVVGRQQLFESFHPPPLVQLLDGLPIADRVSFEQLSESRHSYPSSSTFNLKAIGYFAINQIVLIFKISVNNDGHFEGNTLHCLRHVPLIKQFHELTPTNSSL